LGRAAVRGTVKTEIGRTIVINVVFHRNCEQAPCCLAAKERCAVVVANAGFVAEVVAPRFIESGTFIAFFEAVQADNAHFRIGGRHLPICALHVVHAEHEARYGFAALFAQRYELVGYVSEVVEPTWSDGFAKALEKAVRKRSF